MQAPNFLLVLLLLLSPWLSAKPLQFEAEYQTLEKQPVSLQALIGKKPIYLKFWATWCLDCRRELPSLEQTYQKYSDKIAIFAVNLNINETDEAIRSLQQKHKLTIPILMDNNGTIAGNFEFKGTPFHVLINAQGDVIYTTYKDDAQLAEKLVQLASNASTVATAFTPTNTAPITALPKGIAVVYFTATWCDWYMKDIHPEMSSNCANSLQLVDKLYRSNPKLPLTAYVTHLWTEQTDLADYIKKFNIPYAVTMDDNNQQFRHLKANEYPTLIVFNNGKEIGRFTQFDNAGKVQKGVEVLLKGK
ncbi:TlpA family protein disulfide reductase [Cellvibrio sp. UBA7671]|uniref:TlpA family protein disulfide reductase n=1 Tax=Cellvibrio sp. UBA7671 TaxID=1946312 RepID=UPI002F358C22